MPELPEVETVCLALSKILNNSRVSDIEITRKDLRWNIKEYLEKDSLFYFSCFPKLNMVYILMYCSIS